MKQENFWIQRASAAAVQPGIVVKQRCKNGLRRQHHWCREVIRFCLLLLVITSGHETGLYAQQEHRADESQHPQAETAAPFLLVLGIAQDAGFPQAGCDRDCCQAAWADASQRKGVACLAIVDPKTHERWMIDATPNFPTQLKKLEAKTWPGDPKTPLDGILLTHAHIGHYTGLMHLGREVIGANEVPVFAMPRMVEFLSTQGPWSQLVELKNIQLQRLAAGATLRLNERLSVVPIPVPHRDEFSETVGYLIEGPQRSALYLPDIDKWERWEVRIEDLLEQVDVAYVDGTFYADGEVPGRAMSEIPHPFMTETMERLSALPEQQRAKVVFIHLNHTNPALDPESEASREIVRQGFRVASEDELFQLD